VSAGRPAALAALLCAVAAGGCDEDRTAILVRVCVAPAVSGELAWIELLVDHGTRPDRAHVFPWTPGAGSATYSVRPGEDLSGREEFLLSAIGLDASERQRISRTVRTWFEAGVDRDVTVLLVAACLDMDCTGGPELTCMEGACAAVGEAATGDCPAE
jgi:hypothetical protein